MLKSIKIKPAKSDNSSSIKNTLFAKTKTQHFIVECQQINYLPIARFAMQKLLLFVASTNKSQTPKWNRINQEKYKCALEREREKEGTETGTSLQLNVFVLLFQTRVGQRTKRHPCVFCLLFVPSRTQKPQKTRKTKPEHFCLNCDCGFDYIQNLHTN